MGTDLTLFLLVLMDSALLGAWAITAILIAWDWRQRRLAAAKISNLEADLLTQIKQVAAARQSISDEIGAVKIAVHDLSSRVSMMGGKR